MMETQYASIWSDWSDLSSREKWNRVARRQKRIRLGRTKKSYATERDKAQRVSREEAELTASEKGLISITKASSLCGVAPNTILKWIKVGYISALRINPFCFVSAKEIMERKSIQKEAKAARIVVLNMTRKPRERKPSSKEAFIPPSGYYTNKEIQKRLGTSNNSVDRAIAWGAAIVHNGRFTFILETDVIRYKQEKAICRKENARSTNKKRRKP